MKKVNLFPEIPETIVEYFNNQAKVFDIIVAVSLICISCFCSEVTEQTYGFGISYN